MVPGARNKFGAPMFEPKVFWGKCAIVKKVLATLLGLVGSPSDLEPKALCTICLPFVTPLNCLQDNC